MIKRTQQHGESSQARAKIVLRTSGAEDLDYIPADVLEEHRLAQEALEQKKSQDRRDLKIAYQLAQQEAEEARSENPLLSQVSAYKKIEKSKAEDLKFCEDQLNFRKHKCKILFSSITGQRATKCQPVKAFLKVTREDGTFTTHYHTRMEIFGTMSGWRLEKP